MDILGLQIFPTRDWQYAAKLLLEWLLVVCVAFGALLVIRARRVGLGRALYQTLGEAVLAAGMVAIWIITAMPLRQPLPGMEVHSPANFVPILPLLNDLTSGDRSLMGLPNLGGNIALYVPLGIGLRWSFGLRLRTITLIAICASSAIETWQGVSDQVRTADVNDVILNAIGAWFGGRIAVAVMPRVRAKLVPGTSCREVKDLGAN